jgi:hypothetical protein
MRHFSRNIRSIGALKEHALFGNHMDLSASRNHNCLIGRREAFVEFNGEFNHAKTALQLHSNVEDAVFEMISGYEGAHKDQKYL